MNNWRLLNIGQMKRTAAVVLAVLASVSVQQNAAFGASTVPYKNQKAGQFCKAADVNKTVKLPTGLKLKCLMDGSRARWKNS